MAMINVSDIKPVPSTIRAVMEFLWNPKPFMVEDSSTTEKKFLHEWCTYQYGSTVGGNIADMLQRYFHIEYFGPRNNSGSLLTNDTLGEQYLSAVLRTLADGVNDALVKGNSSLLPCELAVQVKAFAAGPTEAFMELLADSVTVLPQVPSARQAFFRAHVMAQFAIYAYSSAALVNLADVTSALCAGNSSSSTLSTAHEALLHIENLLKTERNSETQSWVGWYMHEWLDGFANVRDTILRMYKSLEANGQAETTVYVRPWRFGTGRWCSWFQYQTQDPTSSADSFPYFHASTSAAFSSHQTMAFAVRLQCGTNCAQTVTGGTFTESKAEVLLWVPSPNITIRYVLGKTATTALVPTSSSTIYSGPISIDDTTAIAAQAFDSNNNPLQPVTRALFVKQ
jgi:hypothetical protein